MLVRTRRLLWGAGGALVLGALMSGCGNLTGIFNPDFLGSLTGGATVSTVPDDAPGIVVWIDNRTSRYARAVVSYRDIDNNVRNFNVILAPGDQTGRMLVCPVTEITLGDVADLKAPGAIIYLTDDLADNQDFADVPFVEVDPFGVLLREEVNYDCGDGLTFSVRETPGETRSGYRTRAEIQRAG